MNYLLDALLANALVALFLAVLAALISRGVRRPALVHALWLIVLLKLITPPLFSLHWPLSACDDGRGIDSGRQRRSVRRTPLSPNRRIRSGRRRYHHHPAAIG